MILSLVLGQGEKVNGQRIQKLPIKQNVLGHVLMLNQSQYTA